LPEGVREGRPDRLRPIRGLFRSGAGVLRSSVRGSVITPVSAEAAAVSRLHRNTLSSPTVRGSCAARYASCCAPPPAPAHADAAVASRPVQPRPRVHQVIQQPVPHERLEHVARAGVDVERDSVMHLAPAHDVRRHGLVVVAGVGPRRSAPSGTRWCRRPPAARCCASDSATSTAGWPRRSSGCTPTCRGLAACCGPDELTCRCRAPHACNAAWTASQCRTMFGCDRTQSRSGVSIW
jgi:hypothetical protein